MRTQHKAALALAFLVMLYTFYTILLQIGGSTIGLIPQLFYAFFVAAIVSLLLSMIMNRGRGLVSILRNPKMLAAILLLGLANSALSQLSLGFGTLGTNPSIASIVYRSWVIFVVLLTPLVLRQKIRRMQLIATLIGFVGLYLIASGGTLFGFNYGQLPYLGLVLFAAMCSVALTLAYSKYTFDIFGAVVLFNLASFVMLGLLAVATHTNLAISFPPSALFTVLFYGAFSFGIASSLYYYSVKAAGPNVVGNVFLIIPFLTILFAAIFTGTAIKPYYVAAALLISAGVLLQRHYSARQEHITKNSMLDRFTIFDVTGAFIDSKNHEILHYISSNRKAFAIRIGKNAFDTGQHAHIFNDRNCIAFTNYAPHEGIKRNELEFIGKAMGIQNGESVLIGMGDPDSLEDAFAEFISASGANSG